jgi:serine/threonine protein kinase
MSDEALDRLAQSFVRRWRDGDSPTIEEYAELHPELADDIRTVFPTLIALESASPAASRELRLPCDLGEYRVLREIGRGGMGVVYEAEQKELKRRVALKVLPWHACRSERLLDRFRREAQAAARLHHGNIVPVHGIGEHDGIHYYTMQFVQGQAMSAVIAELRRIRHVGPEAAGDAVDPASWPDGEEPFFRRVARLGRQVAEALAYAHAQGVIHRDIKPSNLILDALGNVWVTDFGLAHAQGADELTRTGDLVGTLGYMAPERFRGWSDPRSDIYSLGLTLHEMLALRPAFLETDVNRLIQRITDEGPPALRRRCRNVPRDLETIVLRATERDPADRYQTAARLAEDLGLFLAERPIRAQRASAMQRVLAWRRRNPLAAALSVLVAVLLVMVAGVSVTALVMLREERDAAVENLKRAEAAEGRLLDELRSSQMAQARALRASRKQGRRFETLEYIARAARVRPSAELRDDAIAALAQLDVRTIRRWKGGDDGRPRAVDPVGRRYASCDADGVITIHRIDDGAEVARFGTPGRRVAIARFSPDGSLLGALHGTGDDAFFRAWDCESGTVVLEAHSCDIPGTVDFDGRGRAVVGARDGAILVVSAENVTRIPMAEPPRRIRWSADGSRIAGGAGAGRSASSSRTVRRCARSSSRRSRSTSRGTPTSRGSPSQPARRCGSSRRRTGGSCARSRGTTPRCRGSGTTPPGRSSGPPAGTAGRCSGTPRPASRRSCCPAPRSSRGPTSSAARARSRRGSTRWCRARACGSPTSRGAGRPRRSSAPTGGSSRSSARSACASSRPHPCASSGRCPGPASSWSRSVPAGSW